MEREEGSFLQGPLIFFNLVSKPTCQTFLRD